MSASPNLKLPYLDPNQNQKSVTHNAALRMLDALVNLHVASAALQAPPATVADGQRWIVASGGSGAWLGKDLNVAAWQDGAWAFYASNPGFVAYVDALQGAVMWNGSAWVSLLGAVSQLALGALGVGTAADPANPLSARLNAALLAAVPTSASPAGSGDVRLKLSKQAAGNAASLLFQDAYSGRAEVGLVGDDNLHVKVSPDGATFYDALVVAAAGGAAAFLAPPTHPTPAAGDSSTRSATTAFVAAAVASAGGAVSSVAGRTGAVTLAVADVSGAAPLASPALTGTPTAPNAAAGTNTAQVATTSFVAASFVTFAYAGATYATAASPTLTGTPTAPTPAQSDNSTRIATTAYADRAAAASNLARTQINDAAYTVLAADRVVAITALTAARALTLPAASAYPQGATLTVVDESGACSSTNVLTIACTGSDTMNGAASAVLSRPYGVVALESNGANKWTIVEPLGTLAVTNSGGTNSSATGSGTAFVHGPSVTLPANFLQSGRAIRVLAGFRLATGSAPPTLTVQLRIGTTVAATIGPQTPTASRSASFGETFVLQALTAPGASASVECDTFGNTNALGAGVGVVNEVAMPVAVATSGPLALNVLTTWSAAGTGTSTIQLSQFIVEALN